MRKSQIDHLFEKIAFFKTAPQTADTLWHLFHRDCCNLGLLVFAIAVAGGQKAVNAAYFQERAQKE